MEIDLRPPMGGCLMAGITVATLGLYPMLRRIGEKHFIRRMDEAGFETRGGQRIAWSEVRRLQRTVGKVKGVRLSDEIVLHTARGRASLPLWRMDKPDEALAYLMQHVAEGE